MIAFNVAWIEGENTDPLHAKTACELGIVVDGNPLTSVFDKRSRTIRDSIRVPAYPLAEWLAANWWRQRHEAYRDGMEQSSDLLLSHSMAAVGCGFVWPAIEFNSDGHSIGIHVHQAGAEVWEPIKYEAASASYQVAAAAFDKAVAGLIDLTLQRLHDLGHPRTPLGILWSDIQAERADPEVQAWREAEARLGYDADEAPASLVGLIERFKGEVGKGAAYEVLPVLRPKEEERLKTLRALSATNGLKARFRVQQRKPRSLDSAPPWQLGYDLAQQVRDETGYKAGPIADAHLADVMGVGRENFAGIQPITDCISLGARGRSGDDFNLHFRKTWSTPQRFEAARFIADYLLSSINDIWLPLTDQTTFRQKVQRAFATEFLAPIAELEDFVSQDFSDDRIDSAAKHFDISPLAIKRHLANHQLSASHH